MCKSLRLLALALLASGAAGVFAQNMPGLSRGQGTAAKEEPAEAAPAEDLDAEIERLRAEVAERAKRWGSWLAAPPAGIPTAEIEDALLVNGRMKTLIESRVAMIQSLARLESTRDEALAGLDLASDAGTAAEVSIIELDDLDTRRVMLAGELAALDSSITMLGTDHDTLADAVKRAGEVLRRANDAVAAATENDRARLEFQREAALVQEEFAREAVRYNEVKKSEVSLRRDALAVSLQTIKRRIEVLKPNVVFTSEVLDPILQDCDQKLETLSARRQKLEMSLIELESAAVTARQKLNDHLATKEPGAEPAPEESRLRLETLAAESELAAARLESETITMRTRLIEEQRKAWQTRLVFYDSATDPASRLEARRGFEQLRRRIAEWGDFAATQAAITRAEKDRQLSRTQGLTTSTDRRLAERVATSAQRRSDLADEVANDLQAFRNRLDLWIEREQSRATDQGLSTRIAELRADARGTVSRVWNFEMFALGSTGVTVGKAVTVLLFFLVGLAIAVRVARRVERILVSRFHYGEPQARTVRRWMLAFVSLLLLIFALNLVRIPLTAFAFLGGALVIGIGFGTQTIIKNLISGLLVLGERKVRIGDTIEVGNKTGVVTSIDLRSTTVRGFDGVETLIPNSFLLEGQVTNWTHSDRHMRRTIAVGVAYGTPSRKVNDLLLEIAERHGQVLDKPAPAVFFTNFADSSLVFELRVWVDLEGPQGAPGVESDLRHMILKSFAENGVEIPFPQRDLHLRTSWPTPATPATPAGTVPESAVKG